MGRLSRRSESRYARQAGVGYVCGLSLVGVAQQAAARSHGYGPVLPQVLAALGTAHLRAGARANADEAFSAALSAANTLLAATDGMIFVLYARGIASARQAITGERDAARAARRTIEKALTVAPLPGVRVRTLPQFDLLAAADAGGVLTDIRLILAEQPRGNA